MTPPFLHLHDPSMSERSKYTTLRSCFSNQAVIKLKLGLIPRLQTSPVQSPLLQGYIKGRRSGGSGLAGCLFFVLLPFWLLQTNKSWAFSHLNLILFASHQYRGHKSLKGPSSLTPTDKHTHTHVYKMATNTHIPPMGALMSTAALELDPNGLYQSTSQVSGPSLHHLVPIKVLLCLFICLAAQTHSEDVPQLISDLPDMQWG